jgi:hypothetical protein
MGQGSNISDYTRYVDFTLNYVIMSLIVNSPGIPPESAGIPEFRFIPVDSCPFLWIPPEFQSIPADSTGIRSIPVDSGGIGGGIKSIVTFIGFPCQWYRPRQTLIFQTGHRSIEHQPDRIAEG